jgi:hypothetical protein
MLFGALDASPLSEVPDAELYHPARLATRPFAAQAKGILITHPDKRTDQQRRTIERMKMVDCHVGKCCRLFEEFALLFSGRGTITLTRWLGTTKPERCYSDALIVKTCAMSAPHDAAHGLVPIGAGVAVDESRTR